MIAKILHRDVKHQALTFEMSDTGNGRAGKNSQFW